MRKKMLGMVLAGACAGAVNGLLGAGGGMLLVPMLSALTVLEEDEIFPLPWPLLPPSVLYRCCLPGRSPGPPPSHSCWAAPWAAWRQGCGAKKSQPSGCTGGWGS